MVEVTQIIIAQRDTTQKMEALETFLRQSNIRRALAVRVQRLLQPLRADSYNLPCILWDQLQCGATRAKASVGEIGHWPSTDRERSVGAERAVSGSA
eukprot:5876811-Amphidinium_carterae.1